MTPHESHLQSDGSVFPPVTPDPPPSPGQPDIKVPDLVPAAPSEDPDTDVSTVPTGEATDATSEAAGVPPVPEPTD